MRSASQVISRLLMILDHVPGTWRLFSKISPARPSKQPQDRLPPAPMSVVGVIVNPTLHTNQAVGMLAGDEPGLKLALPISLDVLSHLCSLACRCRLSDSPATSCLVWRPCRRPRSSGSCGTASRIRCTPAPRTVPSPRHTGRLCRPAICVAERLWWGEYDAVILHGSPLAVRHNNH